MCAWGCFASSGQRPSERREEGKRWGSHCWLSFSTSLGSYMTGQIMLLSSTLLLYKMRGEDMIRLYLQSRGGSYNGIPEVSYKPKSKTVYCVSRSLLIILGIVSLFLTKSYIVGLTSHVLQRKTLRRMLHIAVMELKLLVLGLHKSQPCILSFELCCSQVYDLYYVWSTLPLILSGWKQSTMFHEQ